MNINKPHKINFKKTVGSLGNFPQKRENTRRNIEGSQKKPNVLLWKQ